MIKRSVADGAQPPPDASPSAPELNEQLTGQRIDAGFVVRYILALMGLWIALLTPASVTLAIRVGQLDPAGKATSLALVASAGAAAALFSNPIFGALSDRSTSRWGRRRPFIAGGLLSGGLAVAAIGFAPSIQMVAVGWFVAQLSFNAAVAALIAVLPERIPTALRGRVSGFMGMAPQVGVVGGTFLIQLVGTLGYAMFVVPTVVGLALIVPFLITLKEARWAARPGRPPLVRALAAAMWINPLTHRDFALAWLGRFCVWLALYQLTTYKTYFLIDQLGYTTDTVAPILTLAMFVFAACVALSSVPGGWLSDQIGRRKPFIVAASIVFGVAMLVVAFATTIEGFIAGIALSGIGAGLYLGVDYALVAQVLPDERDEAAKGMGVFNLSSTLPQTLAPILAPVMLAIGASGSGGNYTALFLEGALLCIVGAFVTQFIRTK